MDKSETIRGFTWIDALVPDKNMVCFEFVKLPLS
jgi:hypothetical protein